MPELTWLQNFAIAVSFFIAGYSAGLVRAYVRRLASVA
jgi:hypothetical protein